MPRPVELQDGLLVDEAGLDGDADEETVLEFDGTRHAQLLWL